MSAPLAVAPSASAPACRVAEARESSDRSPRGAATSESSGSRKANGMPHAAAPAATSIPARACSVLRRTPPAAVRPRRVRPPRGRTTRAFVLDRHARTRARLLLRSRRRRVNPMPRIALSPAVIAGATSSVTRPVGIAIAVSPTTMARRGPSRFRAALAPSSPATTPARKAADVREATVVGVPVGPGLRGQNGERQEEGGQGRDRDGNAGHRMAVVARASDIARHRVRELEEPAVQPGKSPPGPAAKPSTDTEQVRVAMPMDESLRVVLTIRVERSQCYGPVAWW